MVPTPALIFFGFVLPALIVAAGQALFWCAWSAKSEHDARWVGGPLIAAGFAIAFPYIEQTAPAWPPGSGTVLFWIFYFAIALGLLGLIEGIFHAPIWLRAIFLVILCRLAARVIIWRLTPRMIPEPQLEAWVDAVTVVALIWWQSMQYLAHKAPGATVPIVLGIYCLGWAVMLVTWHIIRSGQLAAALAVMCAAAAVVSIWRRRVSIAGGGISTIVLILLAIVVHGYFYTDDTFTPAQQVYTAILLAAPLLAFVGDLPTLRQARPGWRLVARLLPLILVIGIIAGKSVSDYLQSDANQEQGE